MHSIVKKIKNRLHRIFKRQIDAYLLFATQKNYLLCSTSKVKKGSKIDYDFCAMHDYLDETYSEVASQFGFQNLKVINGKYSFQSPSSINIRAQKTDGENWLVFIWKKLPDNYALEFDYYPSNLICEFQLAFNYSDLRNRNRFLVLENSTALFDLVKDGYFYPIIYREDMNKIFDIGGRNHVILCVTKHRYEFSVNGILLYAIEVKKPILEGKDLALILWEDKHNRLIDCRIDGIELYRV